ncbi:MAG: DNA-processing protein DprA [Clostridia bacterium]|nr:DNA-processing protein DprA [Clostridia bacterium]
MFPVRNRIIAGLSLGTLIVGGDKKSGARHTALYAAEYGRQVYAFPYSIGIASGELNNELIKEGCLLCDSVDDIFELLKIEKTETSVNEALSDDERAVYLAIKEGRADVKEIIEKTGKKMNELAPILSLLEIEGYIVKLAGNKFKTVK